MFIFVGHVLHLEVRFSIDPSGITHFVQPGGQGGDV